MVNKISSLIRYLTGCGNDFLIANGYQLCVDLDQWIRRRIRMCYWRQWHKPRTRVRNLLKRGVPLTLAMSCGASRKGEVRDKRMVSV